MTITGSPWLTAWATPVKINVILSIVRKRRSVSGLLSRSIRNVANRRGAALIVCLQLSSRSLPIERELTVSVLV